MSIKRYGTPAGGALPFARAAGPDGRLFVSGQVPRDEDPRDFAEFNKVYAEFFSAEQAPARATVQAALMSDMRVEVDCIAYRK